MTSKLRISRRLAVSLVLGAMTWGVLALSEAKLPHNLILDDILEAMLFPALGLPTFKRSSPPPSPRSLPRR